MATSLYFAIPRRNSATTASARVESSCVAIRIGVICMWRLMMESLRISPIAWSAMPIIWSSSPDIAGGFLVDVSEPRA